jgi:hypothetical protein
MRAQFVLRAAILAGALTAPAHAEARSRHDRPADYGTTYPRVIQEWHDGDDVPDGYRVISRPRAGAIVGGLVTFGSLYLISAVVAAAVQDDTRDSGRLAWLYAPAVGPFIEATRTSVTARFTMLVLDGLLQTGAIALFVYGMAKPMKILVPDEYGRSRVTVRPLTFGKNSIGLGLVGSF